VDGDAPVGPTSFPAFVVDGRGQGLEMGVQRLGLDDLPAGEVLVEVTWSSINFKDGMVTVPGNRVARISPLVPGVDLAGVVVSSDDPDISVGEEVLAHGHDLGVGRHGGFARYARLPSRWALPASGLGARRAMAIGTAGFTAALSIDELEARGLRPGDGPVLVTGATGGVGCMAVALLVGRGYEVVASSGKAAEHDWLRHLGAAEVIGRDDIDDAPSRVLGSERWAGAVDCVGGSTLARVLRCLRYGAAVAASGLTGGTAVETTVFPFITRQVALLGIDSVATGRARRRQVWARLRDDVESLDLDAIVAEEVTLSGLPAALLAINNAGVRGRILVRVTD
jgi:acrylyl-CoA reductase (NADPH)